MMDKRIAQALEGLPRRDAATMTPSRAREALLSRVDAQGTGEIACRTEDVAVPRKNGFLLARVYEPPGSPMALPTVVFFHGGGWVAGDLATHDLHARMLCSHLNAVVVSVDYRRAPEYRFPCAVEDCFAAAEWAADNQADLGGAGAPLAVAGDSAGGNLAAVVALNWTRRKRLTAQLLLYPATDLRRAYDESSSMQYASRTKHAADGFLKLDMLRWYANQYLEDPEHGMHECASPIVSERLGTSPPTVICVAEHDPLADEGRVYARMLKESGVNVVLHDVAGQTHGFFSMGDISANAHSASIAAMDAFKALLRDESE